MRFLSSPIIPDTAFADWYDNQYIVTVPPENLAIPIRDLKEQLRLPLNITTEDVYLTGILSAAIEFAENYTGRDFITRSYVTFRDCFGPCITIRRSVLQEIISIQYFENGDLTLLEADTYLVTQSKAYASVYPIPDTLFPSNIDRRPQAVRIDFIAGYGDSPLAIPASLKMAIVNHAARLYTDRGDCLDDRRSDSIDDCLPCNSRLVYDQYRIVNISAFEAC